MISVVILINDGSIVLHDPEAGAVALAVELLGTIRQGGKGSLDHG